MGIALIFGFLLGLGIGASGGDVQSAQGFGIFLDVLAIIALIVMLIVKPKSKTEPEEPKTNI